MNSHILIIGGDARNEAIIHGLLSEGYTVYLLGYEHLHINKNNIIYLHEGSVDFSNMDAIILPVHGTSNEGYVTSSYTDQTFLLTKEMIDSTPVHCVIYTGIANDYLKHATQNRQMEIIFARDDIAIYNSISTAEATLQLAIEHTTYTIHGATVAVLGFGRVGMTIARLFHNIGAKTTVFVRKDGDIARIKEFGMQAAYISNLKDNIPPYSLCINTIPHLVINRRIIEAMNKNTLILDVASAPGGTDFKYAEELGIQAIHALGLPGKTAPKSAGQILANTILTLMKKNNLK